MKTMWTPTPESNKLDKPKKKIRFELFWAFIAVIVLWIKEKFSADID